MNIRNQDHVCKVHGPESGATSNGFSLRQFVLLTSPNVRCILPLSPPPSATEWPGCLFCRPDVRPECHSGSGRIVTKDGTDRPLLHRTMKWFRPILLSLLSAGLFVLLHFKHDNDVPPPGKFFNPFAGFWQNNVSTDELPTALELKGLRETVRILWDDRRVPHIFAANTHDLFFAQGYCMARDRLWQMDFQARAAAGRLSEVAGAPALEADRFHRRIGLNVAAELVARNSLTTPLVRDAVEAFCGGVNAWLINLDERSLPVEFKILDYQPEEWTPLKTALIFSNFSRTLSFSSTDAALTNVRKILGDSVVVNPVSGCSSLCRSGYPAWYALGGRAGDPCGRQQFGTSPPRQGVCLHRMGARRRWKIRSISGKCPGGATIGRFPERARQADTRSSATIRTSASLFHQSGMKSSSSPRK